MPKSNFRSTTKLQTRNINKPSGVETPTIMNTVNPSTKENAAVRELPPQNIPLNTSKHMSNILWNFIERKEIERQAS